MDTTAAKVIDHAPDRRTKVYPFRQTFGIATDEYKIRGFEEPGFFTPAVNPHHHFPAEETLMALLALKTRDTIYIHGPSGSGKTQLIHQIAARIGYNVMQINFDEATRPGELIGSMQVYDGATHFTHGVLVNGFLTPGTIVLLDEVDMCPPGVASAMQNAVSSERKFLIRQTGEVVRLHPQNVVVATANTKGMGDDEAGLYAAGTNVQNFSFLNRFETTIALDYLPPAIETAMLISRYTAEVEKDGRKSTVCSPDAETIKRVVDIAHTAREQFKKSTLSQPLTTRDCINWLNKLRLLPGLVMQCAKYSFLNRMPDKDAMALAALISAKFTLSDLDDKTYLKRK